MYSVLKIQNCITTSIQNHPTAFKNELNFGPVAKMEITLKLISTVFYPSMKSRIIFLLNIFKSLLGTYRNESCSQIIFMRHKTDTYSLCTVCYFLRLMQVMLLVVQTEQASLIQKVQLEIILKEAKSGNVGFNLMMIATGQQNVSVAQAIVNMLFSI